MPQHAPQYIVEIYLDGSREAAWGCTSAPGPAVLLTPPTLTACTTESEGVELHPNDLRAASKLMGEWSLPGHPPSPGTYEPADGTTFLLALYATYCRGGRLWAVARREDGPGPGEDQP